MTREGRIRWNMAEVEEEEEEDGGMLIWIGLRGVALVVDDIALLPLVVVLSRWLHSLAGCTLISDFRYCILYSSLSVFFVSFFS